VARHVNDCRHLPIEQQQLLYFHEHCGKIVAKGLATKCECPQKSKGNCGDLMNGME
jgi:hypothetical protein